MRFMLASIYSILYNNFIQRQTGIQTLSTWYIILLMYVVDIYIDITDTRCRVSDQITSY